jgi:FkbH-like protein
VGVADFRGVDNVFDKVAGLIESRAKETKKSTLITVSSEFYVHEISRSRRVSKGLKYKWDFFRRLESLMNSYAGLHVIDLDESFYSLGARAAFDRRNWYFAHCRYSTAGLTLISNAVKSILDRQTKAAAKVLVLDCDNTLWGGVIGEDGVKNILLGQDGIGKAFVDFQKSVQRKSEEGTLLTVASKNEELDVMDVFEHHPSMVLTKKEILSFHINWQEKYKNIEAMADELDLGLDSFVFWDDNPLERDKVKKFLPQVQVVEVPVDVTEWANFLDKLECLSSFNISDSDQKKTAQYRARAAFKDGASATSNINEYLRSLNLSPVKVQLDNATLSRAHQLVNKTNQYNLRTKRYTMSEMEVFKADPDNHFMISLSDIYGDHGIVGLVLLKRISDDTLFIDTFLMSCRVLGRFLESWMMSQIVETCCKQNIKYIIGEFIPTNRNSQVTDFYQKHGFTLLAEDKHTQALRDVSGGGNLYLVSVDSILLPNIDVYK